MPSLQHTHLIPEIVQVGVEGHRVHPTAALPHEDSEEAHGSVVAGEGTSHHQLHEEVAQEHHDAAGDACMHQSPCAAWQLSAVSRDHGFNISPPPSPPSPPIPRFFLPGKAMSS